MGISIKITEIGDDDFTIKASGSISSIITDTDEIKFGISDRSLKEAVKNYKEREPTNVYLRSPTPWGDMYSTYDLEQTKKIIKVKETRVVDVTSRPVIVKKQRFENNAPVPSTFSTTIEETVTNTVSSSWKNEKNLSVSNSIGYDVKAIKGETSLSFSRCWGGTKIESKSVTLKTGASTQMTLGRGQSATVQLTAHKKIAVVEVVYECHLEGDVGINYHERYKGYHFHFVPIWKILDAGGIENSIIVKERIAIELYGDSTISVK